MGEPQFLLCREPHSVHELLMLRQTVEAIDVISPVQNVGYRLIGLALTLSGVSVACTEVSRKKYSSDPKGRISSSSVCV